MVSSHFVEIIENNTITRSIKRIPLTPKIFSKGSRHYLHPYLQILDNIDCEMEYYPYEKIIVVSFNRDEESQEYRNVIISPTVEYIVNVVKDFINHRDCYKY